ncbi:hypothetical protein EJ04DRAFT_278096 [Polyplosphaeria fusca]|uniref:Uncharacterized protein n=1 Tax=Polyplosphaeria fusca TaxID=682080 RepID=A0A9P4QYA3_9PLEO|nr:hypothetical protein EJ04DRAFT_278096 [Polyplosphaeria fusca]
MGWTRVGKMRRRQRCSTSSRLLKISWDASSWTYGWLSPRTLCVSARPFVASRCSASAELRRGVGELIEVASAMIIIWREQRACCSRESMSMAGADPAMARDAAPAPCAVLRGAACYDSTRNRCPRNAAPRTGVKGECEWRLG